MTEDEMRSLRLLIREETNTAVYASEERIGNYFNQLEGQAAKRFDYVEGQVVKRFDRFEGQVAKRLDHFEGQVVKRLEQLEERMGRFEIRLDRLEGDQRDIKTNIIKFEANLSETISVIDDVSSVINDLQASQRALELKLEDNIAGMRKELLRLNESIHTFARQFITMHVETNERITWHERTPISETHPKPHSAA